MSCITGDETGLLKVVNLKDRTYVSYGEQSRKNGINAMTWLVDGPSNTTTNVFSVLRANGDLEYWHHNTVTQSLLGT